MKAISEKQPFGHLICAGIKDIENRTWKTNYRGRVLIHASAKTEYPLDVLSGEQIIAANKIIGDIRNYELYEKSAIIGSVEIVDCVENHPSIWAEKYKWHWVLKNPVLFEKPILNVKGKLGFWESGYEEAICSEGKKICVHI